MGCGKKTRQSRLRWALDNFWMIDEAEKGNFDPIIKLGIKEEPKEVLVAVKLAIVIYKHNSDENYICHATGHQDASSSVIQINSALQHCYECAMGTNIFNAEGEKLFDAYERPANYLRSIYSGNTDEYMAYLAKKLGEKAATKALKGKYKKDAIAAGYDTRKLWKEAIAEQLGAGLAAEIIDKMLKMNVSPDAYDRKIFKLSTMCVLGYGATQLTARKDMKAQLLTKGVVMSYEEEKMFIDAAIYSLGKAFPAATEFLKWARLHVASMVDRLGYYTHKTPWFDFPVVLKIEEEEEKKVKYNTPHHNSSKTAVIKKKTGNVDKRSTVSSTVPGIIHSIDASLLLRVKELFGDRYLASIHDSFACHFNNFDKLTTCINIALYELSQMRFLDKLANQSGTEAPFSGDLDCEEFLWSQNAFN
jgi:DNA-directed RNA polymerase